MRHRLVTIMMAAMLLASLCLPALAEQAPRKVLYTGRLNTNVELLAEPRLDAEVVGLVYQRNTIEIHEVLPDWLLVSANESTGYVRRRYVNDTRVKPVDPAASPAYPALLSTYIAWTAAETPVLAAPEPDAEALITLQPGARLAFLGMEDGWAKLIFHRQYAYVDTRLLSEVQPVYESVDAADTQTPIAAFTSFYKITTDETNINRMANITVANQRMAPLVIEPEGRFDFNKQVGPYRATSGYFPAIVLVDGGQALGYGGGTCQVSSTLYNALLQLPGLEILQRRAHGPVGASYLPLHADAAVGNTNLNLRFRNNYPFPVRIDGTAQDGALTIAIYRTE